MITKEDKSKIERIVKNDFELLEWDLELIDEKLKRLDKGLYHQENQNAIIPIYASAVMKAYSKYFGLRQGDIKIKEK
jgi:hypothetical protein